MRKMIALLLCLCLSASIACIAIDTPVYASYSNEPTTPELFFSSVSNLLTAEYTGNYIFDAELFPEYIFLEFSVKEEFFGKTQDDKIYLAYYSYSSSKSSQEYIEQKKNDRLEDYEAGVDYLIAASFTSSPYYPVDYYTPGERDILRVEFLDRAMLGWFYYDVKIPYKILYGENWESVYLNPDLVYENVFPKAEPLSALTEYLLPILEAQSLKDPPSNDQPIQAKNFEETEAISEYVVKVKVTKPDANSDGRIPIPDRNYCRVLGVVKGDISEKTILVLFSRYDHVEKNGVYLVCLEKSPYETYGITSRNAVKTVKEPWVGTVMTVVSIVVAAVCGVAVILAGVLISVFKLRKKA